MERALVIQHFHWDIYWWHSEEESSENLVLSIAKLVRAAEEGLVKGFLLDGQAYPLDELKSKAPELLEKLIDLARKGIVEVGPFYVQIDMYRVSLESIVRNLLLGIKTCESLGIPPLSVAYLPDTFGLPLSLPEILKGFGISVLVASRGLPRDSMERLGSEFVWRSPSGSEVIAIFIPTGYLNAGALGIEWSDVCRLRRYVAFLNDFWSYTSEIYYREPRIDERLAIKRIENVVNVSKRFSRCGLHLIMNGVDRKPIQVEISARVSELSKKLGMELRLSKLSEVASEVLKRRDSLNVFEGELLGSNEMPLLPASSSSRVELKKTLFLVERMLSLYLEPVTVFSRIMGLDPVVDRRELEHVWKELLKLLSHDVACGTITDDVYLECLGKAVALGKRIGAKISHFLTSLGLLFSPRPGIAIYNPMPMRCVAPVEFIVYPPSRKLIEGSIIDSSYVELVEDDPAFARYVVVTDLDPLSISFKHVHHEGKPSEVEEARGTVSIGFGSYVARFDPDRKSLELSLGGTKTRIRIVADEERGDLYNHDEGDERFDVLKESDIAKVEVYRGRDVEWIQIAFAHRVCEGSLKIIAYRGIPRMDIRLRLLIEKPGYRFSLVIDSDVVGKVLAYTPGLAVERDLECVRSAYERFEEFPFQEWVAVIDGGRHVVVGARGLYEYRVRTYPTRTRISITLLRSVEYLSKDLVSRRVLAGPRIRTPLALELGPHLFEICIASSDDLAKTLSIVKSFVVPPIAALVDGPNPPFDVAPPRLSLLGVCSDGFVELHALKPCEDDDSCFAIRLGAPVSDSQVRIELFKELRLALAALNERIVREVGSSSTLELKLRRGSIVTILARGVSPCP